MNYPKTFSRINLGDTELKNRIVSSAISINMAKDDGTVSKEVVSYYQNLAKNNVGLVVVGGGSISEEGKVTKNELHIGNDRAKEGMKLLSKSIKNFDAKSCIQICHVGGQGNPKLSGNRIVGPSKYTSPDIGIECDELKIDEIKIIENQYLETVKRAIDSNFDFMEIHIAHGYLLHQFISEHTNKRNDEYGGSEEKRFLIIKNIFKKLSEQINMSKIGVRISGDDYVPKGMNMKKNIKLVKMLDEFGIAYYTVTAGLYETAKQKYINMKNGNYWNYSKELKKISKTPVIVQGGITSIKDGESLLKQKKGDLFGMAQALIADPELITKTLSAEESNIYECLAHIKVGSCHRCRYLKQKDYSFSCVTPSAWQTFKGNKTRGKDIVFWKKMLSKLKT